MTKARDISKLSAVEVDADATDTTNVTSSGALMDSELTNLAAVKAINQSLVTTASPTFSAVTAATLQTTAGGTVTTASGNDLNIVYPSSRSLFFKEGSTTTLTLDNEQNATFAGNLGINVTPTQKLHVGGNAIITGLTRLGNGTESSPAYQFIDDTNTGMYRSSSDVLGFSTGGGNRLTLNSTGATFAGTVTATTNLVVDGTTGGSSNIRFYDGGAESWILYQNNSTNNLAFRRSSSDKVTLDASGNLGIGLVPTNKLDIKGTVGFEATNSTNKWLAYTYTDNTFRLNYNGSGADELVIDTSGNFTFAGAVTIGNTYLSNNYASFANLRINNNAYIGSVSNPQVIQIQSSGHAVFNAGLTSSTAKTTALSSMANFTTLGAIIDDTTAYNNAGIGGGIAFRGIRNSSGTQTVYGAIDAGKEDTANDSYKGSLRFYTNNNSTGVPTERMRIDSDGYLGIKTDAMSSYYAKELVISAAAEGGITIIGGASSSQYLMFADGTSGTAQYRGYIQYSHNTDTLKLAAAGNSMFSMSADETTINHQGLNSDFRVKSLNNDNMLFVNGDNNRVGIGEPAPDYTLHVNSGATNVAAKFESTDSTAAVMFVDNAGSAEVGAVGNSVVFMPAGTPRLELNTTGNLIMKGAADTAIYKSVSNQSLYISGGTNTNVGANIVLSDAGATTFRVSGNTSMTIDNSGHLTLAAEGIIKLETNSTSARMIEMTNTGVATFGFTTPSNDTIQLETSTTSDKKLSLLNTGSGTFSLEVEGKGAFGNTVTVTGGGASNDASLSLVSDTSTDYNHSINALNPNLTAGEGNLIVLGKAGATKNSGYLAFKYNSDGGDDNLISLGMWGNNYLLNVNGAGSVFLGKTAANASAAGVEFRQNGDVFCTKSSGNVLHVHDTSNYKFYVNANGGIYNYQSNNVNLSDQREKKNIVSLGTKWDAVKAWSVKEFHFNSDADSDAKKLGVIAQDVESSHPELVTEFKSTESVHRKAVKEQQMMWMAIKALQEAQARIEQLETKVTALEA